jgi:hypothetical protein
MDKQMKKLELGDFSKEGAAIAKAAENLVSDIEGDFIMPIQQDI